MMHFDGFQTHGAFIKRFDTGNALSGSGVTLTLEESAVANNTSSGFIPAECYLHSVVMEYDTDSSLGDCDIFLARDAASDRAVVGDGPSGATQVKSPGKTTATAGTFIWLIGQDINRDSDDADAVYQDNADTAFSKSRRKLYATFTSSAGTANIRKVTLNWRASRAE